MERDGALMLEMYILADLLSFLWRHLRERESIPGRYGKQYRSRVYDWSKFFITVLKCKSLLKSVKYVENILVSTSCAYSNDYFQSIISQEMRIYDAFPSAFEFDSLDTETLSDCFDIFAIYLALKTLKPRKKKW